MDVTCPSCGTEYDFDDVLVSTRGTSVKCTQCGHQFRVAKPVTTQGPERWVVRTLDGRELEFHALRELQSAIAHQRVRKDDVLSRTGTRPRRLGSIPELEPFFRGDARRRGRKSVSTANGLGDGEPSSTGRRRSTTPVGLGFPEVRSESTPLPTSEGAFERSVAIPLPTEPKEGPPSVVAPDVSGVARAPVRRAAAHAKAGSELETGPTTQLNEDGPATAPRAEAPRADPADSVSEAEREARKARAKDFDDDEEETLARAPRADDAALVTPAPALVAPAPARATTRVAGTVPAAAAARSTTDPPAPTGQDAGSTNAVEPTTQRESAGDAEVPSEDKVPSEASSVQTRSSREAALPSPPTSERPARGATPAPAAKAPPDDKASPSSDGRGTDPPDAVGRRGRASTAYSLTPTPSDVRFSYAYAGEERLSEPRFSSGVRSRSTSGLRLIVGLVFGGAVIFVVLILVRVYFKPEAAPSAQDAEQDERVTKLVEAGEQALSRGDIFGAKEQYDKASVLAENDPRVLIGLARLSAFRADLLWLELRLMAPDSPDRDTIKRELSRALLRSEKALSRADENAADDPALQRARIHTLRQRGDRAEARALVGALPGGSASDTNAFVLGMLDLAEEAPPWPSVIERLERAAREEGEVGLARAFLTYALARSGDDERAAEEFERLEALPHPPSFLTTFRAFLERAREGDVEPVDVDSLPDVSDLDLEEDGSAPGGASDELADAGSASDTLKRAHEARLAGDLGKAEDLYVEVLTASPGSSEAQTGLADIARARGKTQQAIELYQKVLGQNPGYVPALAALADLKWGSGDTQGAKFYYQQLLNYVSSGPLADRARERLGDAAVEPSNSPPPGDSVPNHPGAVPDDYVHPDYVEDTTPEVDATDLPGQDVPPLFDEPPPQDPAPDL